jgi:hypothetical protein
MWWHTARGRSGCGWGRSSEKSSRPLMAASATWLVYQPLIVGLGAVVVATIGQTALEWYRQHSAQSRRATIIRRAFLEELRVHRSIIAGALTEEQKKEPGSSFLIPIDKFYPIYDNMIHDVGVLRSDEVAAIIKAYSNLILIPKNFAVMGKIQKDDFASFAIIDAKYLGVLESMNNMLLGILDEAISCLNGNRGADGDEVLSASEDVSARRRGPSRS